MKKYFLFLFTAILGIVASAAVADLQDGYYRVANHASNRYIQIMDNKGELQYSSADADMRAIVLVKDLENVISDPATVLYLERHGDKFDVQAQSTGIYQMISTYLNLMDSRSNPGSYWAYGSKGGVTMYLYDAFTNLNRATSFLATKGDNTMRDWDIYPIDSNTDNYFGVTPSVQCGGKYYQPFFADFPFTPTAGMKVYYITKVDEKNGYVVYKEITGTVPRSTPVIIECSSDQPINNKLNIGGSAAAITDNKATGVYFDFDLNKHENFVTYNKSTMRSLGVMSNGQLGIVTGSYTNVPRNQFYVPVSTSAPAQMRLVTEEEYNRLVVTEPVYATSITLSATSMTLTIGETKQITAKVNPDDTTDPTVTWSSSNTAVATVDNNGNITAVGIGSATITAKCGSVTATCQVTVQGIQATSVTLSQTSITLYVGDSYSLSATVAPDNTTDKTVTWSSSNTAVATVDNTGKVIAVGGGSATITAKCGSVSATCQVTVNIIPVTSISLNQSTLTLEVGGSYTLVATVAPANATNKTVTWSSSNTAVATVDNTGKVTAIKAGNATIKAQCGDYSATCEVTAKNVDAQGITLNYTQLETHVGENTTLVATITPANTTDKTVTWTTSDASVATVNASGVVTGVALGNAVITATCGSVSTTCQVTVSPVEATEILLNKYELTLNVGEEEVLVCSIRPFNTTDKSTTWTSSNPEVATVIASGKVTAVSPGVATITVSCANGVSASCVVTVKPVNATGINLNVYEVTLKPGDKYDLDAVVSPANVTDPTVSWTTTDSSIATVDHEGVVTAVAPGSAVITATCGSVSASCYVTVSAITADAVSLNFTTLNMNVGDEETLVATVSPENVTDPTVRWSSSNVSVATVYNGKVTAVGVGTAVIRATCGSVSATCTVTVAPVEATGVTLNITNMSLLIGDTQTLVATVTPENVTDATVHWSSSNTAVATVDIFGKVRAISEGTATITATCGTASATCEVTVSPILATGITLNHESLTMTIGDAEMLVATVIPENTTDPTVHWASTNVDVVTVTADGQVLALSDGTATIIATCGTASATCKVTVNPVYATSITLNFDMLQLTVGENCVLVADVEPYNTTYPEVEWSSADPAIATVDKDGLVTAVAVGTTVITARCGEVTATCEVTVDPVIPTGVELDKENIELHVGDTETIVATVYPVELGFSPVWSSRDESVAIVDQNGVVTAVGVGETYIFADAADYSASCLVKVLPTHTISFEEAEVEVEIGETITLVANVETDAPTAPEVEWSTSDATVATVDANGVVTGVALGTVTITATVGDVYATCTVKVIEKDGIVDITIDGAGPVDVYTVQGIKVRSNATDLKGLPRGVYIVNGEKYYVK